MLFITIREKNIEDVILDSGQPKGGTVSESVMNFGIKIAPHTALKRIALLESPDFHWDNNLLQIFAYLQTTFSLPLESRLFPSKSDALAWLSA
ncbi:hypothetical protein GU926_07845 [Nibribacter ruber]|uniref:STAS/SEC14 domain-containing protein n=1 Tax=Nibribacter ruber TaxID=2698458 RepID=A0A6P1NWB3_9BACT|nr:hypothetical protein [Nibribacter ruber]QHL87350.1 hypothetical protein GU926_07845 [Nibribacter ruber]